MSSRSRWESLCILTLASLAASWPCPGAEQPAGPEPVFRLSFDNGLMPDAGATGACAMARADQSGQPATARFYDQGLSGKALLIGDDPAFAGYMPVPQPVVEQIKESGTVLFWVRGVENWNLWGVGSGGAGAWASFLNMGGGMIYKWEWYGAPCLFGHGPTLFFPGFDQYEWSQLGVSWQREGDGKTRNRIFLNGRLVGETIGNLTVNGMRFGSHATAKGGRHLVDDVAVYDRALPESDVRRRYRREMQLLNQPVVTAPRLKTAPVIDGKIGDEEWTGAAEVSGLLEVTTGEAARDPSVFFLGYDDTFLYVAMKGSMTEQARVNPALVFEKFLRSEGSGRQAKLDADDTVELVVSPDYWKTADHRVPGDWKEYRVLANAGGAFSACSHGSAGANPAWDAAWQSASSVSSKGWQFEARIPFAAFGAQTPAPGDRWGLQLGRVWKHLKDEYDVWCWGARAPATQALSDTRRGPFGLNAPPVPEQPDPVHNLHLHKLTRQPLSNLGVLRFGASDTPVVRVTQLGRLGERKIDFQATVANTAVAGETVNTRLFTDTAEVRREQTLNLPAGARETVSHRHDLNDFASSRLTFEVFDSSSNLIHRTDVPFYLEQAFEARTVQYPNYDKLRVELDLGAYASTPLTNMAVDVVLKDADGKAALAVQGHKPAVYRTAVEVGIEKLAPGECSLTVTVRDGATALAHQEQVFTRYPKAPWYGNRYGYDDVDNDMVPYPWTDMEVRGQRSEGGDQKSASDTIAVWGREYRFGNRLLPEQITTLDCTMLRAPMRLVIQTADGAMLDTALAEAQGAWIKTNRTRVEGTRVVAGTGFSLTNRLWAEYDGLLWNTLTLMPQRTIAVTSVVLELPLTKAFTDVANGGGCLGKLPDAGIAGGIGSIWLGNGDGGVQLLPGEGMLKAGEPRQALRVEPGVEGATLRLTLLDGTNALTAALDFQFGLIATPVRPKTWRTPEHPLYRGWMIGGGPWFPQGLEFMPAADMGADYYGGGAGGRIYVHTSPVNTAIDAAGTDDVRRYGYEWLANPDQRLSASDTLVFTSTESRSFRDFFVWRHWRYQQKYRFNGLYFDNPNTTTLGTRNVMKRMYNIALRNHRQAARDHIIGMAANGCINMGYMGFVMYHWDGEQFNSAVSDRQPTYKGLITPAAYRAEYMGHNLGWTVMFLGQGRLKREWVEANGGAEAVFDQISGLYLLHDSGGGVCCILPAPLTEAYRRMQTAIDGLDLNHWIYRFVPYWRQQIVSLPATNMYASFYIAHPSLLKAGDDINGWHHNAAFQSYFADRHLPAYMRSRMFEDTTKERAALEQSGKERAVMVVYNDGDWEGELRIKPDWQKLGLGAPDSLTASNAVHSTGFRVDKTGEKDKDGKEIEKAVFFPRPEEYARIAGDELIFPMTKFNYRMIVLEKK
ncbi:MAG: DUF6067 family protein [Kiritimatiellae bacterium]|nr:DUF6067 family protein [Kiritimatiellia bacterium]